MTNLIFIGILFTLLFANKGENSEDSSKEIEFDFTKKENIDLYFQIKRKQHLDAIKTLLNFDKYERKYEMMSRIYEKLFNTMEVNRQELEKLNFIATSNQPFPVNKTEILRNALQIIENCAFFANLALKLPDINNRILQKRPEWSDSYKWCFDFTEKTQLIDAISTKMFNLAAQQLNLIPRDEDFVNPYERKRKTKVQTNNQANKRKIVKGPRMSKAEL